MPGNDISRLALRTVGLAAAGIAAAALPPAMARPERSHGPDVAIVLDVSMSMLATDIRPDRLTEARRQIAALLRTAAPERAAVVAFAGDARVICPLTADLDAALDAVAGATPDAAAPGGSDITAALERASELLGQSGSNARVVLVTDGEAGPGPERLPAPIARALAARGAALTVVGIGTLQGAPIPRRDGGPDDKVHDDGGHLRLSRMDRQRLVSLADAAGGRYAQLEPGKALVMSGLIRDDAGEDATPVETWMRTGLPVLVAIGALLLDSALWWLRRSTNPWD